MGTSSGVVLILSTLGGVLCNQAPYPQVGGQPPDYGDIGVQGDAGGYYSHADYGQDAYDFTQYADTDRTADLIGSVLTLPMIIVAFLAALLGGIIAPMLTEFVNQLGDLLGDFPIELPEIPTGRMFDETLAKPVSTLFKLASSKLNSRSA